MASISGCAKADEADLVGNLTPVIGVGDEEDTVAELIEWPRLKGARVEYPTGSSRFREFSQFDNGLTLPLSNLAKNPMNMIGACPAQSNYNFWEVILVCETLNRRWAASGSESRITAKDFMEYYAVKYVTTTDGINSKVLRKETFIDVIAREGNEPEAVLKDLEISRFKRVANKDDKLVRLNEILDGPVDMATVSSTVVWNLAKRKAVKRGAAPYSVTSLSVDDSSKRRKVTSPTKLQEVLEESNKITEGEDLRPCFVVKAGLLVEQCRAKAREKMVAIMDDEFKKDRSMELEKRISQLEGEKNQLEENLTRERGAFQLEREKEREVIALKLKEVRAEREAEVKRLVTVSAISRNNLAGKLYQLRYTKAEIMAFSKGNYVEMKIMDEEEVEEKEDGLNVVEKTAADNQKTINQYEDRLDDNVKLYLKLEEAKRQVEEKTATILSRDLALNRLTSEHAELKEKTASGSRYGAELAEYCIRALNEEISDMKCNIRTLNEQLLKREIELDTARTNLAVKRSRIA
ncbi:hypothetical protein GIB67_030092 [Kingdonia uniflora]|uniref:Uncharacterized protein n=1 Tax=Kingdonia uniflora TaxID=39325 RepID=A0A7J7L2L5_9MAGN|nr:hypothetical protein GIB67_030092 [Kingdonia uniflora]